MSVNDRVDDVKAELGKRVAKLVTLRDEARLHMHLASMDAKQKTISKTEDHASLYSDTLERSRQLAGLAAKSAHVRAPRGGAGSSKKDR